MRETRSTSLINRIKLKDSIIPENGQSENGSLGDVKWVRIKGSSWWPAQVVDEASVSRKNKPRKKTACETLVRVYGTYNYLYVDLNICRSEFENAFKNTKVSFRKIIQNSLQVLSCSSGGKSTGEIDAIKEMAQNSEDEKHFSVTNPSGKSDFNVVVNHHTGVAEDKKIIANNPNNIKKNDKAVAETTTRPHSRKRKSPGNVDEGKKDGVSHGGNNTFMQSKKTDCFNTRKGENGTRISNGQDCTTNVGNDDLRLAKTPDSNIRRIKMMQRLALIAPEGSPFRNGPSNVNPVL